MLSVDEHVECGHKTACFLPSFLSCRRTHPRAQEPQCWLQRKSGLQRPQVFTGSSTQAAVCKSFPPAGDTASRLQCPDQQVPSVKFFNSDAKVAGCPLAAGRGGEEGQGYGCLSTWEIQEEWFHLVGPCLVCFGLDTALSSASQLLREVREKSCARLSEDRETEKENGKKEAEEESGTC